LAIKKADLNVYRYSLGYASYLWLISVHVLATRSKLWCF